RHPQEYVTAISQIDVIPLTYKTSRADCLFRGEAAAPRDTAARTSSRSLSMRKRPGPRLPNTEATMTVTRPRFRPHRWASPSRPHSHPIGQTCIHAISPPYKLLLGPRSRVVKTGRAAPSIAGGE